MNSGFSGIFWTSEVCETKVKKIFLADCLMVAPLTESDGGKRRVYIPDGNWVDYRTGEPIKSGWYDVEAKRIPIYRKI